MPLLVGVSFRQAGRIYSFDRGAMELREGDRVIAETERGVECGQVMVESHEASEEEAAQPLKAIIRKATDDDLEREEQSRVKEREALHVGQRKIEKHGLPMKLIDVEYTFDGRRIVFHFSAEGRVDFRTLVRDLAGHFRARIELHQVGVRDEAKMIGGIGPCGRLLCCSTFLSHFEPVTIKMAKEQGLSLNPLKISGLCGRLMCCLEYENAFYREAKQDMPRLGSQLATERGEGKVVELRVPKGTCVVALPEGGQVEVGCGRCCGRAAAPPPAPPAPPPEPSPPASAPQPAQQAQPAETPRRRRPRPRPDSAAKASGQAQSPAKDEQKPQPSRPRRRRRRRPRNPPGGSPPAGN